jgi:hypothetical protein
MSIFFRQIEHLLPNAAAWRITLAKTLRNFFEGLTGIGSDAKDFIDDVYGDVFPETTRELAEWEAQFGIEPNAVEATRRLNLAAEWAATGGQSPSYIQGVLQTAGFDVYVHEWWSSGPSPWIPRNPRDYTDDPLIGQVQCGETLAQCGEPTAVCNGLLANEPGYVVNDDLSQRAPAPIPNVAAVWPYFFYIGAETFPDLANIDIERRAEFRRLVLKLKPAHVWVVLLIDYTITESNVVVGTDLVKVGTDQVVVNNG